MTYIIRNFRTGQIVLRDISSYEEGFDKCIELYLKSGKQRTFYVAEAAAQPRVRGGYIR